ncbi:MAG: hypothetical protein ABI264_15795 [Pseudonocardiaceae bacterium]
MPGPELDFAPGVALRAVYQECAVGGHLVDDQAVVRILSDLYGELSSQALGKDGAWL